MVSAAGRVANTMRGHDEGGGTKVAGSPFRHRAVWFATAPSGWCFVAPKATHTVPVDSVPVDIVHLLAFHAVTPVVSSRGVPTQLPQLEPEAPAPWRATSESADQGRRTPLWGAASWSTRLCPMNRRSRTSFTGPSTAWWVATTHWANDKSARRISIRSGVWARSWATFGRGGPDTDYITELRRLPYGLHAVLGLHTTQEEEN